MEVSYGIALGALWGLGQTVRVLVNKGLISPAEVDEIYSSIIEGAQGGNEQIAAIIETQLQGVFAEMRAHAEKLYKG